MSKADYKFLIDWFQQGVILSEFEGDFDSGDTDGWEAFGTTPPTLSLSNTYAYSGDQSLLVFWLAYNPFQFDVAGAGFNQGRFGTYEFSNSSESFQFDVAGHGFDDGRFGFSQLGEPSVNFPEIRREVTGLTVGLEYTISARVLHPFSSDTPVKLGVVGMSEESNASFTSTVAWQELTVTFTATSTTHTLRLFPTANPDTGDRVHLDYVVFTNPVNDVSERVLARRSVSFRYGRDFEDSTSIQAPVLSFELDNQSLDYMPNNPASPIAGFVGPGKPVKINAEFEGVNYPLFNATIDDFEIFPHISEQSVRVTARSLIGAFAQKKISTELHPSLQTGEAIHKILDAIDWPVEDRDINSGATTIRWWWEDDTTALDAITKVINSEGGPALFDVSPTGIAIFRDRHHRLGGSAGAIVRASGAEPLFSQPMSYDISWKYIVNDITVPVSSRVPASTPATAWETKDTFVIQEDETKVLTVKSNDPFIDAITPVAGTDYVLLPGSGSLRITLSRTSGQSTTLSIRAIGADAVVQEMKLRATLVPVESTYTVKVQDPDSIAKYGSRTIDLSAPWVGINDAPAIAAVLLGQKSEILPLIHITLNNDGVDRFSLGLRTELSDVLNIVEPTTFTDDDFFVDSIEHNIDMAGHRHTITLGCQKVQTQVENVFTFDVTGAGFDDGLFGRSGIDDHNNVFYLDSERLNEGLLGH